MSCTRPKNLSITHMVSAEDVADLDVGKAREPAPDDGISWRRVARAIEVAAEASEDSAILDAIFIARPRRRQSAAAPKTGETA